MKSEIKIAIGVGLGLFGTFYFATRKPTLIFTVGIPGSGKSTWAKKYAEEHGFIRVNLDDIRKELTGDISDMSRDKDVVMHALIRINMALLQKKDVLFDATNTGIKRREEMLETITVPHNLYYKKFDIDPETAKKCIEEDLGMQIDRSKVPPEAVDYKYNQMMAESSDDQLASEGFSKFKELSFPKIKLPKPSFMESKNTKVLRAFDMDGTLVDDFTEYRGVFKKTSDEKEQKKMLADIFLNSPPNEKIRHLVDEGSVVITARAKSESYGITREWLDKNGYGFIDEIAMNPKVYFSGKWVKPWKVKAMRELGVTHYYDDQESLLHYVSQHAPEIKLFHVREDGTVHKYVDRDDYDKKIAEEG